MADLNKLTNDEQLILINQTQSRLSFLAISQLTDENEDTIKRDISVGAGEYIAEISDTQAKDIIETSRLYNNAAARQAKKYAENNNLTAVVSIATARFLYEY